MLICFFVCMLILFCLEIAAAVLAFVKKDKVKDELENELKNQIKSYTGSAKNAVDDMQKTVKCCGITTYEDWKSSDNLGLTDNVPDSCCTTVEKDCGMGQRKTPTRIYTEGCYRKIKKDIDNNLVAVGAVTITILVIQLLAMIFAMFLVCRID